MKKIIAVLFTLVMLFAVAGCGGGADSPEDAVQAVMEAFNNFDPDGLEGVVCESQMEEAIIGLNDMKEMETQGVSIKMENMKYELMENDGKEALVKFTGTITMTLPELGEQTEPIEETVEVIKEDGKWKVCEPMM